MILVFSLGAVELVQCSDLLPELRFSSGTNTWKVSNAIHVLLVSVLVGYG